LALFSSCAPPLPRRHVNRMKRLLEATTTPAIKSATLLCNNKTGSRTRRPIEMGYESSAVEIRARRGSLTWWNKRSPVKMDESSWAIDELSCCPPSVFFPCDTQLNGLANDGYHGKKKSKKNFKTSASCFTEGWRRSCFITRGSIANYSVHTRNYGC
jgi:hypothetical protein